MSYLLKALNTPTTSAFAVAMVTRCFSLKKFKKLCDKLDSHLSQPILYNMNDQLKLSLDYWNAIDNMDYEWADFMESCLEVRGLRRISKEELQLLSSVGIIK